MDFIVVFLFPLILLSSNVTCFPVLWNFSKLTTVSDWGQVIGEPEAGAWQAVATWASVVISGDTHLSSGVQIPAKGTGWQAHRNILERARGRPLLVRFPDQILDQRHMPNKPQVPAGGKVSRVPQAHSSTPPRHLSPIATLVSAPLALVYPQNLAL